MGAAGDFAGNRVTRDSGAQIPILNAPIGFFARSSLAGAVAATGALGVMEANSTDVEGSERELAKIRETTSNPVGLHLLVRSLQGRQLLDEVIDWAVGQSSFIVTGNGKPDPVVARVHDAGAVLYHQVGSVDEAVKSVDAGVDGLIVEGAEAGGLRGERALHIFSLLQKIRSRVDVPLVAAGGIVDGHGMAGAFALGADAVMMGTRFMSAAESPVHQNWKDAVTEAETTMFLDVGLGTKRMRVVKSEMAESIARGELDPQGNPYGGPFFEAFKRGRTDLAMVGAGETATLIDEVLPVAEIVSRTVEVFWQEVRRLAALLPA